MARADGERSPIRQELLPVAGVLALGALAYMNSLSGDLVFDDIPEIRDNPSLADLGSYLWGAGGYRAHPTRFLGYLSFALNRHFSGLQLGAWRATNLAIHLASALLVYALVRLAFRAPRLAGSRLAPSARALAFAVAALFVTHPLQTQAVTYLVQRLSSLAALFYLATLVLYLWWRLGQEQGARPAAGVLRCAGWAVAALLAVHTKEIAVTLPAAALLLEVALFGRPGRRQAQALVALGAIALLVPVHFVAWAGGGGALGAQVEAASRLQTTMSRLDYLRTEVDVVARYLGLLAWPAGQNLDHDVPVATSFLEARVLGGALVHAVLLGLAVALWRGTAPGARRPLDPAARLVAAGIAFFYLALSVESSVFPIVDPMYEHRVYLPSVGALLAAVVAAALLLARVRSPLPARALVGTALGASLCLGGATLLRNRAWFTELSIWQDAAAKSPGKARPQRNLGGALLGRNRPAEAVAPLREAVRLEPANAKGHAQLASALLATGQVAEGEVAVREALRLAPDDPESIFNLAMVLTRTGRAQEARGWFARFLDVAPPSYDSARRLAASRLGR